MQANSDDLAKVIQALLQDDFDEGSWLKFTEIVDRAPDLEQLCVDIYSVLVGSDEKFSELIDRINARSEASDRVSDFLLAALEMQLEKALSKGREPVCPEDQPDEAELKEFYASSDEEHEEEKSPSSFDGRLSPLQREKVANVFNRIGGVNPAELNEGVNHWLSRIDLIIDSEPTWASKQKALDDWYLFALQESFAPSAATGNPVWADLAEIQRWQAILPHLKKVDEALFGAPPVEAARRAEVLNMLLLDIEFDICDGICSWLMKKLGRASLNILTSSMSSPPDKVVLLGKLNDYMEAIIEIELPGAEETVVHYYPMLQQCVNRMAKEYCIYHNLLIYDLDRFLLQESGGLTIETVSSALRVFSGRKSDAIVDLIKANIQLYIHFLNQLGCSDNKKLSCLKILNAHPLVTTHTSHGGVGSTDRQQLVQQAIITLKEDYLNRFFLSQITGSSDSTLPSLCKGQSRESAVIVERVKTQIPLYVASLDESKFSVDNKLSLLKTLAKHSLVTTHTSRGGVGPTRRQKLVQQAIEALRQPRTDLGMGSPAEEGDESKNPSKSPKTRRFK